MKIELSYKKVKQIKEGVIVVFIDGDKVIGKAYDEELDAKLLSLRDSYREKKIKVEAYFTDIGGIKGKNLLVYWTGLNPVYPARESIKIYTAKALNVCKGYGIKRMSVLLNTEEGGKYIESVIEGAVIGSYAFNKYKKEREDYFGDFELEIIGYGVEKEKERELVRRRELISEIVNECRDIVNEPGSVIYPEVMANIAEEIGMECGIEVRVWDEKRLEKEGYNGLLQVGRGSSKPPYMVMMEYKTGDMFRFGLVGKGITFDSGGISLKPAARMGDMKGDMAGAGAVMYAMKAIAKLGLEANVVGIMALAENLPGANAQRPGDIFYAKNGKTILVDNTDAEGRLILTDAFYLAGESGCSKIVDIATLTGSCVKALGTSVAGIMGNDKELIQAVIKAGREEGEEYWELPLIEEYKEMLKSDVADISNVGGVNAGVITAALFLREFLPEKASWAHLDIAGPFLQEKPWKHYSAGATGFGLKTLVNLIYNIKDYELDKGMR